MWSDRYYYLNIYKDKNLGAHCDTKELGNFIATIPELRQVAEFEFMNNKPFPFTQLLLLNAGSIDNWSASDTSPKYTNLITIVCEKNEKVNFEELKRVFIQIASWLDWKLVDEETEAGMEYDTIWESA